jgi:type VI secretion system FHA domain protein
MQVTLEVVSENGQGLGAARRRVFDEQGGKIGRAAECEWVLPNPYISRHHATVRFIAGSFYIESVGENGISVNGPSPMLGPMERQVLKSGDRIFMDEYEIGVSVVGAALQPAYESQQSFPGGNLDSLFEPQTTSRPLISGSDPFEAAELDPLKQLPAGRPAPHVPDPNQGMWNHTSGLADHFTPPAVNAPLVGGGGGNEIPADWDKTSFNRTKWNIPAAPAQPAPVATQPARAPAPVPAFVAPAPMAPRPSAPAHAPAPGGGGGFDVDSFLRGAGIDPRACPPETAAMLGQILKLVVQGTIDVLRARAEIKSEFRLQVTRLKVSENNPLKFSVNAEDAMASFFTKRNNAYLPPVEAFQDAFEDIRNHQLAMLAGMRSGFDSVLERLDAATLQEQFDKQIKRGGLLSMSSKSRYWDLFEEYCRELGADRETAFRRLFGEEFGSAYETQLDKLKRSRDRKQK